MLFEVESWIITLQNKNDLHIRSAPAISQGTQSKQIPCTYWCQRILKSHDIDSDSMAQKPFKKENQFSITTIIHIYAILKPVS